MGSDIDWGGSGRQPTAAEVAFAAALQQLIGGLDYWLHEDDAGSPWLLVSLDFGDEHVVRDVLRLDVDGSRLLGGWSPACLNWDDGVRAEQAGIDTLAPDGIHVDMPGADAADLARIAAEWFARHRDTWPLGPRAARWQRR